MADAAPPKSGATARWLARPRQAPARAGRRRVRPLRAYPAGVNAHPTRALQLQHHLARRAAAVDQLQGVGDAVEGEAGADDRADEARLDQAIDGRPDRSDEVGLA